MGRARGGAEPGQNRPQSHWDPWWSRARPGQSRAGAPGAGSGKRDRLGTKSRAGPPTPPGLCGLRAAPREQGGPFCPRVWPGIVELLEGSGLGRVAPWPERGSAGWGGGRVREGGEATAPALGKGRSPWGRAVVPLPRASGHYGALPAGERPVSGSSAGTGSAGRTWVTQSVAVSEGRRVGWCGGEKAVSLQGAVLE